MGIIYLRTCIGVFCFFCSLTETPVDSHPHRHHHVLDGDETKVGAFLGHLFNVKCVFFFFNLQLTLNQVQNHMPHMICILLKH